MSNIDIKDLNDLKEFLKWRKENPKEYKEFMNDLKDFFKELNTLMQEVLE